MEIQIYRKNEVLFEGFGHFQWTEQVELDARGQIMTVEFLFTYVGSVESEEVSV